jgi:hypothetical protein
MLIWNRRGVPTPREVKEDEEDNTLLSSLQLDQEAALIDLQEAEQAVNEVASSATASNIEQELEDPARHESVGPEQNPNTTVDDEFLSKLQEEVESLRSRRTSSYSLQSASDSASTHSKRLSELSAEDRDRISRRWSRTLSEGRSSYAELSRGSRTSSLPFMHAVSSYTSYTMQDFGIRREAEDYCFSCFDLSRFSSSQSCLEILTILFKRYGLGDDDALQGYQVKLLIISNRTFISVSWLDFPMPLIRGFTQAGRSCAIVLQKTSEWLRPDTVGASGPLAAVDSSQEQHSVGAGESTHPLVSYPKILPISPLSQVSEVLSPLSGSSSDAGSALTWQHPKAGISKGFQVSIDEPYHKVLAIVAQTYQKNADWRQLSLYIIHHGQERQLGWNEKPMMVFQQLIREERKPTFMLRKIANRSSLLSPSQPIPLAILPRNFEYSHLAKAIYSYKANPGDAYELSFQKYEILYVLEVKGRWWQVKKENGETGVAPSNYLNLI